MAVAATDTTAATVEPRPRLFTIDEYVEAMVEPGIIGEDERVELIEGQIVEMPPTGDASHLECERASIWIFASRSGV